MFTKRDNKLVETVQQETEYDVQVLLKQKEEYERDIANLSQKLQRVNDLLTEAANLGITS